MERRDFIRKAALASGAIGFAGMLPDSIQKALAINPENGTTFLDAEHVVILMQENRSFDHCYGSLQGARGFNDPRAITLPDKNPVWLQTNAAGETYAPFRLNIKDTKATWMGSLPHSWADQVDAYNKGKHDQWLQAKRSGHPPFAKMPLTLGYYTREDIPFYYSLADAFTVCDQNFCSSLTGTTPNRLFLWTGTIRESQNEDVHARVKNENADYLTEVEWTTFPERLQDQNISWKIYQNELSVGVGLTGESDSWLTNFGDNPIEYFKQFQVRFHPAYMKSLPNTIVQLKEKIASLEAEINERKKSGEELVKLGTELSMYQKYLKVFTDAREKYTPEAYEKLSQRQKALHENAFVTNKNDPDYHQLTPLTYKDGGEQREINIPKGDVLFQFRADVSSGKLSKVSWLVAPENLSDHPTSPWYGAAYISEALDILTRNPEVWKKTIFILAYDENDGYFDHVPPFTAPNPHDVATGATSKSIDTRVDYVTLEQDKKWKSAPEARDSSIGLGFRVPLVIASPWSRGGVINSQVFDHTSVLQLLEKWLSHKTGKKIEESNISAWRRAVCGDLSSAFRPYNGEPVKLPVYVAKDSFYESIHQAKFKKDPIIPRSLTSDEIAQASSPHAPFMPRQEKGTRASCALPYTLYADGGLGEDKRSVDLNMTSSKKSFGDAAAGSPFKVYAPGKYRSAAGVSETGRMWSYAVEAGDKLPAAWPLSAFENENYFLRVYGPNGFFRELKGTAQDPSLKVVAEYELLNGKTTGNIELQFANKGSALLTIEVKDNSYNKPVRQQLVAAGSLATMVVDLKDSFAWYDFTVTLKGSTFERRYAGRVETGRDGVTDPAMA